MKISSWKNNMRSFLFTLFLLQKDIARNKGKEANFSPIHHIIIALHQSCGRTDITSSD
jgi:hypothetical protein